MQLREILERALAQTTFRTEASRVLSVEQLRQAISESYWGAPDRKLALAARTQVPDELAEPLAETLQHLLDTYIDASSGHLGHSFRVAGDYGGRITFTSERASEIQSTSDLTGFARALVRAAAVLGSEPAAQLVEGWADGKPLRFKICLVIAGIYVAEPLDLGAGLRVYPLPISSEGLPLSMPDANSDRVQEMLGHPLLEIDAHTDPVFFLPPGDEGTYPALETVTALRAASVERFLTALSLVCNRRVGVTWSWSDYSDAAAFATGIPSGLGGPGSMRLRRLGRRSTYEPATNITSISDLRRRSPNLALEGLSRSWGLVEELQRRMDNNSRFRIAVKRWEQAADLGAPSEDRIIDLRIALEALYLDSSGGELGFRLSTTCARHLGTSLEERQKISTTVTRFYRLASRVIHGTELVRTGDADADLLRKVSRLCRDGILKIVETKHQPDWSDLILG